ncbi:hypothetical protein [Coralloluteibacterium stylophorae]|uniref:Uncharacterized protein n=1 Tax=Coralloluteibacterium stylophorae TaxID=1776034 RepID=A0AAP2CCM7_9GAMM|nr:hypothetical protein [Coralloluteibacterium stylophorae]MBS7457510.1 hypothetical protein [Coralloluteibacterium stylophorae]
MQPHQIDAEIARIESTAPALRREAVDEEAFEAALIVACDPIFARCGRRGRAYAAEAMHAMLERQGLRLLRRTPVLPLAGALAA